MLAASQAMTSRFQDAVKRKDASGAKTGTKPTHDLAAYAGEYESPGAGILKVVTRGAALEAAFNGVGRPVVHLYYDVFQSDPCGGTGGARSAGLRRSSRSSCALCRFGTNIRCYLWSGSAVVARHP